MEGHSTTLTATTVDAPLSLDQRIVLPMRMLPHTTKTVINREAGRHAYRLALHLRHPAKVVLLMECPLRVRRFNLLLMKLSIRRS